MSMVTLKKEMENCGIDPYSVVRINTKEILENKHSISAWDVLKLEEISTKDKIYNDLNELHGKEVTLEYFIQNHALWADDFEWYMSKDKTKFTHVSMELIPVDDHLKMIHWMELIIQKGDSNETSDSHEDNTSSGNNSIDSGTTE